MNKRYLTVLLVMALLSPLGLLTKGTAWGEWAAADLQDSLGYIPQGMERFGDFWQAAFPDYSMKFLGSGGFGEHFGYILSALLGSIIIYGVIIGIFRLVIPGKAKQLYQNK